MAYATISDIEERIGRTLTQSEQTVCNAKLDDAAVMIDAVKASASADAKKVVSCNMVIRVLGNGAVGVPMGATQGSMSALGYSQSWTIGSGGSTGELYFAKADRQLLGLSNAIGSYSPVEDLG